MFAGLYQDVRYGLRVLRRERSFAVVAILTIALGNGEPTRIRIGRATASLFHVLRAQPLRGRVFTDADSPEGSHGAYPDPTVAILSYGLWQDWYGGRDDAIGSTCRLDDSPVTV